MTPFYVLCFLQVCVMESCERGGSKQLLCIPYRICLKVKIAQAFFCVFAVFHHLKCRKICI